MAATTSPEKPESPVPDRPVLLVVDDTVELGLIVRHLGRRAGQEVVVCGDVPSGWDFLQQRLPDLVLLDLNLPGPSGLELCRLIRATPRLAHLRVALFSHWQLPQDILAGLETGIDFVVSKELVSQSEAWQARIREILSWIHGRRWTTLLSWMERTPRPQLPGHWVSLLNQALRHATLSRLRPQILRFLLGRSLRQIVSSRITEEELDSWLMPEEGLLAGNPFPHSRDASGRGSDGESVIVLVVSLAEQTWCLLGTEATAAFRSALAAVVPGLEEFLSF